MKARKKATKSRPKIKSHMAAKKKKAVKKKKK